MFSKPIIRLISIVVLIIAIIALVTWYFWPRTESPISQTNAPAVVATNNTSSPLGVDQSVVTGAATSEGALGSFQTARFIAERFASYSSEANYSNIESLYPLFTKEIKDWAVGYVAQQRALVTPNAQPYRVESRVVGTDVQTATDTSASYTLQLQRQEERGIDAPKISQRNLVVGLTKTSGVWLVDHLKWE